MKRERFRLAVAGALTALGVGVLAVVTVTSPDAPPALASGRPTADPPTQATVLFRPNYAAVKDAEGLRRLWKVQVPHQGGVAGPVAFSRLRVVPAPGDEQPRAPEGPVLRAELRPFDDPATAGPADGDVTDTGGFLANRAEVYSRIATGGTPPERWPDPVGSTRSYAFSVFLPKRMRFSAKNWLLLTQWKGLRTGTPPVSLEISDGSFRLGGKISKRLGPARRGRWTTFLITLKFSPDPAVGTVAAEVNGRTVIPETHVATMRTYGQNGVQVVDPVYLKQGLYRSKSWTARQVVYFSRVAIATTPSAARATLAEP